jgi:enoyl-CoA hydratase/carnithine racemase
MVHHPPHLRLHRHTLLPEALETWPVPMFERLLPRHLEIIYALNHFFLEDVRARHPGDDERIARVSLIQEVPERRVRMANLAVVGSFAVNGVAELQSRLLPQTTLRDFADLWPEKFLNETNGVSPRRFLHLANPRLSALITARLGEGRWLTDLERLGELEAFAGDAGFRAQWREVKRLNKLDLAAHALAATGVTIDPSSLFDVMVKRLHEYKRQFLKLLHVVTVYNRIKADPAAAVTPCTVIFGAKAAPGYQQAKRIIKLINSVAAVVNADPDVAGRIKVVFLPDYNVSVAEVVVAAGNVSEQISLAGKEAWPWPAGKAIGLVSSPRRRGEMARQAPAVPWPGRMASRAPPSGRVCTGKLASSPLTISVSATLSVPRWPTAWSPRSRACEPRTCAPLCSAPRREWTCGPPAITSTNFPGADDPLGYNDPREGLLRAIRTFPTPVVAMVHGTVWGGALDLVLSCDLVTADETASFAITPANLGLPYNTTGLLHFLGRLPINLIKEMFFTAAPLDAQKAKEWLLVNHLVGSAELEAFTLELAAMMAAKSPMAIAVIKEQLRVLSDYQPIAAQVYERIQGLRREVYDSSDYLEGLNAFAEKRRPIFRGI